MKPTLCWRSDRQSDQRWPKMALMMATQPLMDEDWCNSDLAAADEWRRGWWSWRCRLWWMTEWWCRRCRRIVKQVLLQTPSSTGSLMSLLSTSALPSSLCWCFKKDIRFLHYSSLKTKICYHISRFKPLKMKAVCRSLSCTHPPEVCLLLQLDRFSLFYTSITQDVVTVSHFLQLFRNTMHHITCSLILRSTDTRTAANTISDASGRHTQLNNNINRRAPNVENVFEDVFENVFENVSSKISLKTFCPLSEISFLNTFLRTFYFWKRFLHLKTDDIGFIISQQWF